MLICLFTSVTIGELFSRSFPESIYKYNLFPRTAEIDEWLTTAARKIVGVNRKNIDIINIKLSVHLEPTTGTVPRIILQFYEVVNSKPVFVSEYKLP